MTTLLTAQPARHPNPIAKATSLANLIFERPDLDQAERFLLDFGLCTVRRSDDMLKAGDLVEASIRSTNGRVDLGMQRNPIVAEG